MAPLDALFGEEAGVVTDRNFQLLLLANVTGPLGLALISPILDTLTGPFGVSPAAIGLMVSATAAPGIVVVPLAGVLADRYGRRTVLTAGLGLFGSAGMAIAATTDFRVVLALRLLQGFGFAGIVPIIITSVGDMFEGDAEATAQGFRFATSGVSLVVFPILAGALVVVDWRIPFLLYGIALPLAVLIAFRLEEPAGTAEDAGPPTTGGLRSRVRAVGRLAAHRRVMAILIARALPVVVWAGFLTYNSILVVRVIGGTPQEAGLLVAVGSLVFAGSATQAGRVTALFDSRYRPLIGANACLGAGFGLVSVAGALTVALAGAAVTGVGFGLLLSLYRSMITGFAPVDLRGGLVSLGESFGRVAATVTPVAMGAAVAMLEPSLGFAGAVRWTALGTAGFGSIVGTACLVVANRSPRPIVAGRSPDATDTEPMG